MNEQDQRKYTFDEFLGTLSESDKGEYLTNMAYALGGEELTTRIAERVMIRAMLNVIFNDLPINQQNDKGRLLLMKRFQECSLEWLVEGLSDEGKAMFEKVKLTTID